MAKNIDDQKYWHLGLEFFLSETGLEILTNTNFAWHVITLIHTMIYIYNIYIYTHTEYSKRITEVNVCKLQVTI